LTAISFKAKFMFFGSFSQKSIGFHELATFLAKNAYFNVGNGIGIDKIGWTIP
jgi:hypothetical protein